MNFQDAEIFIDNQRIYNYYKTRLVNMALSQFVWENLDESMDRLYFEKKLLFEGKACMIRPDMSDEWLSLGYVTNGDLNVYGYPTDITGVGYNSSNIKGKDFMVLYDNPTRQSIMEGIDLYSRLLAECHQVYRANLRQQVTPYIVTGTKNQELTFKNLFARVFSFYPYILLKKKEDKESIDVLNLNVKNETESFLRCLKTTWAEAISMLGICPAGGIEKKERLITDEVAFDKEEYIVARNSRELMRKEFCDKFNKKYNKNIGVHMASVDLDVPMDMAAMELDLASNSNATDTQEGGQDNE